MEKRTGVKSNKLNHDNDYVLAWYVSEENATCW